MKILETVLYAEDLEAARTFYVGILGLEEILFEPERDLFLRCEDSVLIVFKASETVKPHAIVPPHGTSGAGHAAFAATDDEIDAWRAKLTREGVAVIKEVDWPNGARSIYFLDPEGNVLEFATPRLWGF